MFTLYRLAELRSKLTAEQNHQVNDELLHRGARSALELASILADHNAAH